MSDLERKSVEPIALAADVPPRTLQKFLATHLWDEDAVSRRQREILMKDHADENAVAVIDETSLPRRATKPRPCSGSTAAVPARKTIAIFRCIWPTRRLACRRSSTMTFSCPSTHGTPTATVATKPVWTPDAPRRSVPAYSGSGNPVVDTQSE
ncbi:MAG: transposase [Alphaproteobacteria bacterium]|nr:transposase [Alphaproteobacteria bacterium]